MQDIFYDLSTYLDLEETTVLSSVSTQSLFKCLYNIKHYRFIPRVIYYDDLYKLRKETTKALKMIKSSENINIKNREGYSLLHSFIYGNVELIKGLIKRGANINIKGFHNITPLHRAVMDTIGKTITVKILLNSGADPNCQDGSEETPLHRTAWIKRDLSNLKLLINAGGDINIRNNEGETLLDMAKKLNNTMVTQFIQSLP